MSGRSSTLELILELRNRLGAGLSSARQTLRRNIGRMRADLAGFAASVQSSMGGILDQIPGAGGALSMLANPYAAVAAGVIALGAAYGQSARMANQWETGMSKVNVTAQLTKAELAKVSDQVLDIGSNNTTPLMEVPDAFNKIVSAGLDVKTALTALDPVLKASQAGFTDVGTVAAATVNSMNSTGITDATRVLDVLFATMNKGNAEFADIANYLPKIIPMADKAGQSFEDLAGAFAYFTAQGFKTEQTATLLENMFKSISDPRITDGFKKVGVNIYDSAGKARPMLKILADLRGKLDGLSDKGKNQIFKTIGTDGETTTAIGAMLKDYDKLKEIIEFTNSSQGELNEAIKNAETPTDVWAVVSNQVKATMIEIGRSALPWIKQMGTYVLETIKYWKDLWATSMVFRDSVFAIGKVFEVVFNLITMGVRIVWGALSNVWTILGNVKEAIFGAGDGFEQFYVRVKPYLLWVYQYLEGIASLMFNMVTMDYSGMADAAKSLWNAKDIGTLKAEVQTEYRELKKKAEPSAPVAPIAPTGGVTGKNKNAGTGEKTKGSEDAKKVTGSASQIKNLTINMDAMVKMGDFVSKNPEVASMNKRELEEWFTQLCARMIHNLETSYG